MAGKDVLEFPLEDLEVPQAIRLMMSSATKCVTGTSAPQANVYLETDDERLADLCEKLEVRIEDAIDAGKTPEVMPDFEDELIPINESDIWVTPDDSLLTTKGVVFIRACNAVVINGGVELTYCIKKYDHRDPQHEDMEGNVK